MGGVAGIARRSRWCVLSLVAVLAAVLALLGPPPREAVANASAPRLYLPGCPGRSQPLLSSSFPPGTYDLASAYAGFDPSTLTVRSDGTTTKVTATVDNDAPGTFEVTATPRSAGAAAYSFESTLDTWPLQYDLGDGSYAITGGCFGPGDIVDLSIGGPAVSASSVTANADGYIAVAPRVTAGPSRTTLTVTATDTASGRRVTGTFPVPATTLPAGEQLSSSALSSAEDLYAPNLSYELGQRGCTTELQHFYTVHGVVHSPSVWHVGTGSSAGSCRLRLLSTGDLVLTTAHGTRVWHTGTASTGSHNRLVVLDDGKVVLRTDAGNPIWTSKVGLIRGSNGYTTHAAITSTRSGSRVDVAGDVRQYTLNGTLKPGAGRVVHLERRFGTAWQIYRSTTAGPTGRVHFSFRQAAPLLYRLEIDATRRLATAHSRTVRR